MRRSRKPYRRKHNLSRIKQNVSYEYHEVAALLDVSKGTVRNWVKLGLPAMQSKRPPLIHGAALKAFLSARQNGGKKRCRMDEIYCLCCKQPRHPWEMAIDVKAINETKLLMMGICGVCERSISKIQPMRLVPQIIETFRVQQWHGVSIIARMHPCLNYHLHEVETNDEI